MTPIEMPTNLEDWMPMEVSLGPPLPKWLQIFWPWYKPAVPPIYACPYCGAEFSSQAELLAHFASDHPTEPPEIFYVCPICGAQFSTMAEYNQHVAAVHPPTPPPSVYTCPMCGATFSTQAELDYHIQTAHPPTPPPSVYTCPVCGTTFATPREVIDHIAINHLDYQFGLIFGTIKDIVTLQPIAGVLVTLDSMSQITDSAGNFLFVDVPIGSYIVRVTKDGYFPWEGEREINEPGDTESLSVRLTPMPGPGPELTILGIEFPTTLRRGTYIDENYHEYIPVKFTLQINVTNPHSRVYRIKLYGDQIGNHIHLEGWTSLGYPALRGSGTYTLTADGYFYRSKWGTVQIHVPAAVGHYQLTASLTAYTVVETDGLKEVDKVTFFNGPIGEFDVV